MPTMNLTKGQRAQRKYLITVAEWTPSGSETAVREILGTRTEDSTIEFNPDIQTSTDILGITYTDVNKTEPQQDFDPMYVIGQSALSEYMTQAALANNIDAYNNVFNVYIITVFMNNGTPTTDNGAYYAVCHSGCSIIPTGIGGDSYVNMPIEVHFSNNITEGHVDKLTKDFAFTAGALATTPATPGDGD